MSTPSPSGRQVTISAAGQEAVVVEVGGGLRSYSTRGRAVLDGYAEDEVCSGGRGQILAPWPNRLGDGSYEWGGTELQAALTEPEHGNAIHGLVRWATWTVAEVASDSARLGCRLHPQPGWPWTLDLAVSYTLGADGLAVRTTVENPGDEPCPFGVGWHPYLSVPGLVDDSILRVPAATAYEADERGWPTGTFPVARTDLDYRGGASIGAAQLDRCFCDLERRADGRAVVTLESSAGVVSLWMDAAFTHVMVYTGDTLPSVDKRRRGLAVEPMTCPANMLRTGTGRIVLYPGESFEAEWGITPPA